MSKKDIARSALEGGRANGYEKKLTHRERRVKERAYLRGLEKDPEAVRGPAPRNRKVYKLFTDKLGPAHRWLAKQVGRRWDDVYSELKSKYDVRSLNGYHIVVQHLLPQVYGAKQEQIWRNDAKYFEFKVSKNGVLVKNPEYSRYKKDRPKGPTIDQVSDKIGKRLVGIKGGKLFWLIPRQGDGWTECLTSASIGPGGRWLPDPSPPIHNYGYSRFGGGFGSGRCGGELHRQHPEHKYYVHAMLRNWRFHREFTKGEVKWWRSVAEQYRKRYLLGT